MRKTHRNQWKNLNHMPRFLLFCVIVFCLLLHTQCRKEKVPEPYRPSDAHTNYLLALQQVHLTETALGKDWIAASQQALNKPVEIELPFEESFYIDSTDAFALAYRFDVKRGRRIEVNVSIESRQPVRLFMDLFRVPVDSTRDWVRVASAPENEKRFDFEPRRDANYVIRLQPELLRGGRCRVIIRKVPSLAFPVPKRDRRSILSFFGDPRDGGRREHHGVDIFAPRHTPIIAPLEGRIRYVGESGIGGNVIWLWDSKRVSNYYFAHLQSFNVKKNDRVEAGQIIGTMGNTGNARTTSPHLHFGIYVSGAGPVDPYYFITKTDTLPEKISANQEIIGHWVRTNTAVVPLQSSTGNRLRQFTPLPRHTPMQVLAASKDMYRVRLPDHVSAYVKAHQVESMEAPLLRRSFPAMLAIRETPEPQAVAVKWTAPNEEIRIHGTFNGHWYVRKQDGQSGWILAESQPSSINSSSSSQGSS